MATMYKTNANITKAQINYNYSKLYFTTPTFKLKKGTNYIKLYNLPFTKSDRVYVDSTKNYHILSVDKTKETKDAVKQNQLIQEIDQKREELYNLNTEIEECDEKLRYYKRAFNYENNSEDFEQLREIIDKYISLTKDIKNNQVQLRQKADKLVQEIDKLKLEYSKLSDTLVDVVSITLDAKEDVETNLTGQGYTYQIMFKNQYVFNLDDNQQEICHQARIINRSNIDLKNVKVTFKTCFDNQYEKLPDYDPFDIDSFLHSIFSPIQQVRPMLQTFAAKAASFDSNHVQEETKDKSSSLVFNVESPISINKDSDNTTCLLNTTKINGEFEYITLPSKSNKVYLTYKTDLNKDFNMLDNSEILIKFDNNYINKLAYSIVDNKLTLTLDDVSFIHVDRSKSVKHFTNMDKKDDSGIEIEYSIKLNNTSNKDIQVKIVEPLPKTNSDKVKVTILKPEQSLIVQDEETNSQKLETVIHLKPQSEEKIDVSYKIEGDFSLYIR